MFMQPNIPNSLTSNSNKEIFLQDFVSEADASVLLENLKEMFPRYYMHSNVFNMHNYSKTPLRRV